MSNKNSLRLNSEQNASIIEEEGLNPEPKENLPPVPPKSERKKKEIKNNFNIFRFNEEAKNPVSFPEKSTSGSSGYDVKAYLEFDENKFGDSVIIHPGQTILVPTGLGAVIKEGYEIQIRPRSGLSKKGIKVDYGTIDSDYRGEIKVSMYNSTSVAYEVHDGDRIAQLVFAEVYSEPYEVIDKFDVPETSRGEGGFGHTGV